MSHENVEIVRRVYESFERRDWDSIVHLFDPNVEQHGTVGGVEEGQVVRGLLQIRQHWQMEDDEIWDEHRFEPQEFIDAGDQVVVFQREYQRGKSSGVELVVDTASILDLRGGRIVRLQGYMDRAAALKAAGLSDQTLTPAPALRDTGRAMSRENVETLHRIYELLNTHFAALKGGDLDELVAFFDPEVVIESVDGPQPETYHGHDGVRSWFNDIFGPWAAYQVEADDIKESGQWTVALLRVSMRGEASGIELELPIAAFHQFRDGKIVRDRIYLDRDEGLKAFGLSE